MFQNAFQSGPSVEVLSSCDKHPAWVINKSNWKFYEKTVKGYIILIDSHTTKLIIPSNDKLSLSLVQPYLVLQIYITPTQPFTLELAITDISSSKRRLVFSSASKDLTVNPMHARIPNSAFIRGIWANISIDLVHCVQACFGHSTFRSLDSITISSFCRLRRVFTMRSPLMDTTGNEVKTEMSEQVPKNLDFPGGVQFVNQNITPDVVLPVFVEAEVKTTPKKNPARPPMTTAPLEKLQRPGLRTSSVNKKQGNTTTTFFQRKKEARSPRTRESIKFVKVETPKQSIGGRLGSAASNRYHQAEEEKSLKEEENPLEEMGEDEQSPNEFHHLTNYRDSDEVMSNSIEEEIETESVHQENNDYNPGVYMQPDHNYFPQESKEEEAPKPTFFSSGITQATQYRPFTPPFAGLSAMKSISVTEKENEEEAVELVYDPVLQCYYDPSTMEYYQVNE